DVRLHHLAFQAPDLLGASDDSLAHLGEQLFRGRGTRTQRFQAQIQRVSFGLMPLVRLVARGGERGGVVLGGRQADGTLFGPCTRRRQGILALREARDRREVSASVWSSAVCNERLSFSTNNSFSRACALSDCNSTIRLSAALA